MFADVIVDITNEEVDKLFEYSFTDCRIQVGSRVVVPFGKKVMEGIVLGVKDKSIYSADKIKPILRLLEEKPVLTNETLALMEHVRKTCYVTRALSLRLFLPSEMRKGKVKEQFVKTISLKQDVDLEQALSSFRNTAKKQKEFLVHLFENGRKKLSEVNNLFGASAVKAVIEKGLVDVVEEKYFRSPYKDLSSEVKKVVLTSQQENAVNSVLP